MMSIMRWQLVIITMMLMVFLVAGSCVRPGNTPPSETGTTANAGSRLLRERIEVIPADIVKITPETDLYPPVLHSDLYEPPVPLPGLVNTAGGEDSPFILPDGNTLYFFFTPDVRVPAEKQLLDGATGIYRSKKQTDGRWSGPERIVLNDDISLDGAAFIRDNTMWFCSARPGYEGINWFTASLINDRWQHWQYAGGQFPPGFEVGELHFSMDWQELYYHSPRAGGKGGLDIWVTRQVNGAWQEPENLHAINTTENEGWPCLAQNDTELWFLRTYLGTPAIFRSVKVDGAWLEPELIISQFAGEPSVDNQGNLYFVHHYYRDGVMLEADIYVALKK